MNRYCGSAWNVNEQATVGELHCPPLANPSWGLPADVLQVDAHAVVDDDPEVANPWGPLVRPVAQQDVDPYNNAATEPADLVGGKAHFVVDQSAQTPWGPLVRAILPIGCQYTDGTILQNLMGLPMLENGRSHPRRTNLNAHPEESEPVAAWGPQIKWRGNSHCDRFADMGDPWPTGMTPMQVELFGYQCAFCPVMLWTAERPGVACSYPAWHGGPYGIPHGEQRYDWCASTPGYVDAGGPTCVPYDPIFGVKGVRLTYCNK